MIPEGYVKPMFRLLGDGPPARPTFAGYRFVKQVTDTKKAYFPLTIGADREHLRWALLKR